jgi:hypothetical protein
VGIKPIILDGGSLLKKPIANNFFKMLGKSTTHHLKKWRLFAPIN